MQCKDFRDRLIDVTDEDLVSQDPKVREHLKECARCRQDLQRSDHVWALLADIPEPTPDWSGMRERFAGMMEGSHAHRGWPAVLQLPAWRPVYAAMVIIAALAAGTFVGRQIPAGGSASSQGLNAMRQELRDLRELLALSLMQQALATDRIKGASWAARMDDPRADVLTELIDVLLHDPNVNVRLACLRALERFGERPAVREGVAKALAGEQSSLVSVALIEFVVQAKDKMAIDALRRLSEDPMRDQAVRDTAAQAIERLLKGGQA
jgi:hypothetical protein